MANESEQIIPLLLTATDVMGMLGIGRTKLHELRASGAMPHPCYLGGVTPRWRRADIESWLASLEPAPTREVARARSPLPISSSGYRCSGRKPS